ncbi:MAG: transposase [Candidatus Poribacteria bacterium]|nr:transposase [Candidatus Poribacteria bacterium]
MTTSSKCHSGNRYKGRVSIPGAYYHIIICTHQRQKILADNTIALIIFNTFDWLEAENCIEWICIMVMPDHVHTVIKLGEGQTLSKVCIL